MVVRVPGAAGPRSSTASTRSRGSSARRPAGAFYVFPVDRRDGLSAAPSWPTACSRKRASASWPGRPSAGSATTTSGSLCQLAGEHRRGARRGSAGSSRARVVAEGGGRPRVFVARRIPDEGLDADRRRLRRGHLAGRAAPATRRAPAPRRRVRRDPDPADRPGRRRAARRRRARAARSSATTPSGSTTSTSPRARGAGSPVGNTPGVLTETTADLAWALLMAAARRLPEGDRYVRGRRVADLGPAAAARAGRPRRHDRDRGLRPDRPGGGATGAGVRDGDPVPRRRASCRMT